MVIVCRHSFLFMEKLMTSYKFSYNFDVRPYVLDCYQSISISLGPKWGDITELSY